MIQLCFNFLFVDKFMCLSVLCVTLLTLINGQINIDLLRENLRESSVVGNKTPEKFALELYSVNKKKWKNNFKNRSI